MFVRWTARRNLSRGELRVAAEIQRARSRFGEHGGRNDSASEPASETAAGLQDRLAGEYASHKRSQRGLMIVLPITILVIFIILYTMFGSFKWALLRLGNLAMDRRFARAVPVGNALQRVVGCGISGAIRRFGSNRRHHAGVHQSTAHARTLGGGGRGGRCTAFASDSDDDVGGYAGAASGGLIARHRLGFAASVCHRDCGGTYCRAVVEHLRAADVLCAGGAARR